MTNKVLYPLQLVCVITTNSFVKWR